MAAPTVTIDGSPVPAISTVAVEGPEAPAQTTGDGGETTTTRVKGNIVRITVGGDDGLSPEDYATILALRNGVIPHAVVVTYPSPLPTYTFDMNWKRRPPLAFRMPGYVQSFTFDLTERP